MFGETADLVAVLGLKDQFSGPLKKAKTSLSQFDAKLTDSQGRAFKAGQQIGTGILNAAKIATVALGGLTGLLVLSAKEGQDALKVQQLYANAIANSGKVTADYVAQLNAQQTALMNLSGADDEAIKAAQTQLITMGLTGAQILKLTPLALDLATATGKDLTTATLAVGKAAQGSTKALQQMGIILPKGSDAVGELEKRFKGATAAVSGGFDVRLKVLDQALGNLREAAGIKLLPALTRLVDIVSGKLVPAFGSLLDTILPSVIDGLNKLGDFLESGAATSAITKMLDLAKQAAPIIKSAAEDTLFIVKSAVSLFSSLPPELQAMAVAGFTINKLTGGLITNVAGGLAGAIVTKLVPAILRNFTGAMNVNAGVVNVNGAVGGGPGGPSEPGGGTSKMGKLLDLVSKALIVGFVAEAADLIHNEIKAGPEIPASQLSWPWGPKNTPDINLGPLEHILGGDSGFKKVDEQAASLAATLAVLNNTAIGPGINGQPMGPRRKGPAPTDVLRIIGPGENGPIDNLTRQGLRRAIDAAKAAGDPKAAAGFQRRLEARIKAGNITAQALRIQKSTESSDRKLADIKRIQDALKNDTSTMASDLRTRLDDIRKAIEAQQTAYNIGLVVKSVIDSRTVNAALTKNISVTGGIDLARGVVP